MFLLTIRYFKSGWLTLNLDMQLFASPCVTEQVASGKYSFNAAVQARQRMIPLTRLMLHRHLFRLRLSA